jgi:hypothetical protein
LTPPGTLRDVASWALLRAASRLSAAWLWLTTTTLSHEALDLVNLILPSTTA